MEEPLPVAKPRRNPLKTKKKNNISALVDCAAKDKRAAEEAAQKPKTN